MSDEAGVRAISAAGAALWRQSFADDPALDRGRYSFWMTLLRRADQHAAALAAIDEAIAAFPEEFTYHHSKAGLLLEMGQHSEALAAARTAHKHAYGDMTLRAVVREAEILVAMDQTPDAVSVLRQILETAERPPEGTDVRTWRYLGKARDLLSELEGVPPNAGEANAE